MYLVAPSRAVKIKGIVYEAGAEITTDMIEEKEIKSHIEAGFINDTRSAPPLNPTAQAPSPSKYLLNPANLRGKSLQELNLLVKGKDVSVEPFETVEEAIAHLSADYEPETPAAPAVPATPA